MVIGKVFSTNHGTWHTLHVNCILCTCLSPSLSSKSNAPASTTISVLIVPRQFLLPESLGRLSVWLNLTKITVHYHTFKTIPNAFNLCFRLVECFGAAWGIFVTLVQETQVRKKQRKAEQGNDRNVWRFRDVLWGRIRYQSLSVYESRVLHSPKDQNHIQARIAIAYILRAS